MMLQPSHLENGGCTKSQPKENSFHCFAQFPAQEGSEPWIHKWKGHAGCAGNVWCRRLETLTASVSLGKVAFPRHPSEMLCCCSLLLDQVLLSLPVVQRWRLCGVVCACSRGGNRSWLSLWDVEQSQKPRLCLNPWHRPDWIKHESLFANIDVWYYYYHPHQCNHRYYFISCVVIVILLYNHVVML